MLTSRTGPGENTTVRLMRIYMKGKEKSHAIKIKGLPKLGKKVVKRS